MLAKFANYLVLFHNIMVCPSLLCNVSIRARSAIKAIQVQSLAGQSQRKESMEACRWIVWPNEINNPIYVAVSLDANRDVASASLVSQWVNVMRFTNATVVIAPIRVAFVHKGAEWTTSWEDGI
mmetsp:Transcript_24286/g.60314  ORF Transcript_24286/g.60314 Transcript_24286/m.60314 type:complete len:124 (-) Transcript_24286:424-795(-)